MRLTRRTTMRVILAAMVVALAGLIAVQWYLLRQAMELKEQAFRRNVFAALNTVAQKLEAGEAYRSVFASGLPQKPGIDTTTIVRRVGTADSLVITGTIVSPDKGTRSFGFRQLPSKTDSLALLGALPSGLLRTEGNRVVYTVQSPQHVRLQRFDLGSGRDTVIVDTFRTPGVYEVHVDARAPHNAGYFYSYTTDSSKIYLRVGDRQDRGSFSVSSAGKEALVNRVVDRLIVGSQEPIERRVNPVLLDSLLSTGLRDAGVPLAFARAVASPHDSVLKLVAPEPLASQLKGSDLRTRLFPTDILAPQNDLVVYFPDQRSFLLAQIGPQLGATGLFTLVIVLGFIYGVRTISAQGRLARLMTDFINNMTHEFKTPISTVSLAVEAIERPDVVAQPAKVLRYNGVIRDEMARMRTQVEKILQMAVLEGGEYELNLLPVDVHEVIRRAAAGLALQAEHRGGSLTLKLDAPRHEVNADGVHLANIMNNLLDNANKYSPETPRILVSTRNEAALLVVRIEDNGIGIAPEHLAKV
ncbi:MAG TPA: HAMP domain-containing sensor histidine kinase, partial [Bacteroidota bacterium]